MTPKENFGAKNSTAPEKISEAAVRLPSVPSIHPSRGCRSFSSNISASI
jgi:hypothetical protein